MFYLTETIHQLSNRKRKQNMNVHLQNQHGACFRTEEEKQNCVLFAFMCFPSK